MLQRHAIQTLHGDEGFTIFLAEVGDSAYAGWFQGGCSFRLPPKSLQSVVILGYVAGQFARGRRQVNL